MEHLSSQKASEQALSNHQVQQNQDDEIDLKELLHSLWEGKFIVILMTLAFLVVSISYSLMIKEKWEAKSKISQPEISQFSGLQSQVGQLQPAFNQYASDGTIVRSTQLDTLVSSKNLLNTFVQQFNNRKNKKKYLDKNTNFRLKFESLEINVDEEQNKIREQALYHAWYNKLSINKAVKAKGHSSTDIYDLVSKHNNAQKSYDLLVGYLGYVEKQSRIAVRNNIQTLIDSKKDELQQQINILKEQAKSKLLVETLRSKYELDIAKTAGILRPLENYEADQDSLFNINLGSDALGAKIQVLNELDNLNIFEPMIAQYEAKLDLLKKVIINESLDFQVMQYVEAPEKPHKLSAPNRSIISILGGILGAGLGVVVVLIGTAFRKNEETV